MPVSLMDARKAGSWGPELPPGPAVDAAGVPAAFSVGCNLPAMQYSSAAACPACSCECKHNHALPIADHEEPLQSLR